MYKAILYYRVCPVYIKMAVRVSYIFTTPKYFSECSRYILRTEASCLRKPMQATSRSYLLHLQMHVFSPLLKFSKYSTADCHLVTDMAVSLSVYRSYMYQYLPHTIRTHRQISL